MAAELDHVADLVEELYGLDLDEFVATRKARARELPADARAVVAGLPKPVVAAWLVNQVVRAHRGAVQEFLGVGAALRHVQATGSPDAVRALNDLRRQGLVELARRAEQVAAERGQPVADDVRRAVEDTWRAGLAHEQAARAVLSGRLVRPLAPAGFGDVDLTGALGAPALPTPPAPAPVVVTASASGPTGPDRPVPARRDKPIDSRKRRPEPDPAGSEPERARAQAEQKAAAERRRFAERRTGQAERAVHDATRTRDRRAAEVARLTEELRRAQLELDEAQRQLGEAERTRDEVRDSNQI